jgi:ATP-binding cassette subfamily B multidrug efflux pump
MTDVNPTPISDEEVLEIAEAAAANAGMSGAEGVARKAKHFWPSFWRMMGLLKPYWIRMVLVTVVGAASVVLTVLAPRILGRATDVLFSGYISNQIPAGVTTQQAIDGLRAAGQTDMADMVAKMDVIPGAGIDFNQLANILLLVLALYVGAAVFSWLQGYVLNRVMVRAMWKLRGEVEDKINRLPLSYFDRVKRGDLISRVTNDIDNMTNTLQQSMSGAITSVFTVIGALVMMLTISWQLTLIALVSFPLLGIIFGIIGPKSQKAFSLQWLKVGRLNARVEESFSGHALVKVFGQQKRFEREFAEENEELYQAAFKAQFLSGLMMPMMSFIGNLVYVGIAVVGAVMVAGGSLLLGSVQAFIQYSSLFNQPLAELGGMAASVQSGVASTERVYELLDEADEVPDDPDAPEPVEGQGRIEFEHVKFSYSPSKPLIEDLSFTVEPGQTVAIVGPTGAGKTTLVNLLMRFYELDGGKITVNGQNIAALKRDDVRRRTGMVLQDPWLFAGTINQNIRYGNEDATDEQIIAAAKATYVDRLVRQLPKGYETELDEDASNLSAGERQLLTIARAFVAQPPILILDEATSSVDTRTERLLQDAMNALQKGRTSFVIAHRLSTIREADLILVMENGAIVEKGTHEELIKSRGAYWRLYNSQFEGAL